MVPTGRRIREGRALTGMSQADLAAAANVALGPVVRVEASDWLPMATQYDPATIQGALEAAGVVLPPENGGGAGVRLPEVEKESDEP